MGRGLGARLRDLSFARQVRVHRALEAAAAAEEVALRELRELAVERHRREAERAEEEGGIPTVPVARVSCGTWLAPARRTWVGIWTWAAWGRLCPTMVKKCFHNVYGI